MEELAATLMRVFAIALDLPETFFDDKIDRPTTRMRAINYPDQPDGARQGQLRSGAHSDYGSLTILHFDDAPGGLPVRNGQAEWVDVAPVPGGFVVNLGDLMANCAKVTAAERSRPGEMKVASFTVGLSPPAPRP